MTSTRTKARGIIFTGESVCAILEGRKTQTRRVCKRNPGVASFADGPMAKMRYPDEWTDEDREFFVSNLSPYGNRLWVREAFWAHPANNWLYKSGSGRIHYDANLDDSAIKKLRAEGWQKKSPIHMPRWASRLTLEVTEVRVERLQDISEQDALAEGVAREYLPPDPDAFHPPGSYGYCSQPSDTEVIQHTAKEAFAVLWDQVNGKNHPWASNPWVWVISFQASPKAGEGAGG